MGEPKIERSDYWSKILPPADLPKRDLLSDMEPVHATESGSFEEVRYDIPVSKDGLFADSLQRSARKFGTQPPASKKERPTPQEEKVKVTVTTTGYTVIASRVKGLDNVRKNLQEVVTRLAKQKKITVPEYCRFEVSEYIIKNRNCFPFLNQAAIEEIKAGIKNSRHLVVHDYMLKKPGAPDTYRCIVSIPQFLASWKENPFKWFAAALQHEITHCRDSHPDSGMEKLIKALGISRSEDAAKFTHMHEYVAYIELLESFAKEKIASEYPVMAANIEKRLILYASKLTLDLAMMDKHKQRLARKYFAKRIRGISQGVKDRLRKRLAEEHYFNDRSLALIGL